MTARPSQSTLIAGAALILLLAGVAWMMTRTDVRLSKSATGFDGVVAWLADQGHDTRKFGGGYVLDPDGIGLRLLPLYDLDVTRDRRSPTTKQELLRMEDERDITFGVVARKASTIRTMVILPKWRSGVRLSGAAHPEFLNDEARVNRLLAQLFGGDLKISTRPGAFTSETHGRENLSSYAMRTVSGDGCEPVIGTTQRMLLGVCTLKEDAGGEPHEVLLLADPDLLNNHGLHHADNAVAAANVLPMLADGGEVLIDYSSRSWVMEEDAPPRDARSWSDLKRYFGWPFSILWAGAIATFLIALWRGSVRFGAPLPGMPRGPGHARDVAMAAQARLLRITGDTAALGRAYVDARLESLAANAFGARAQISEDAFWRMLARRAPEAGRALRRQAADLRATHHGNDALLDDIRAFEHAIEQVRHELDGR